MAMSTTTCCLNNLNPPPRLLPKSTTPTTNQLLPRNGNGERWQKRCVLGVVGVAMALQMVGESGGVEMGDVNFVDSRKWSEERMCPQWRLNSLETIVPENLPRPAARRRWEPAALPRTAPQLRTIHPSSLSTRCFSM
ncbi:uncharacterized protein LOC111806106 [Cucurbita pepo subsp. pepo]|uniref:uncharacterized protein LOC111806106 n=1 Tax=Cucurbita pepo subsp. pepo TaxID=3664 RepID=UPI000C9D2893|nr:uncharacterized protein LOC111806106 [Cucurbita pepo subsp. pepo]